MKSVAAQKNRICRVIGTVLCLLGLLFPLTLRAEPKTTTILAFGMWLDNFYIGVARNDGSPLRRYGQYGFSLDPSLSPDGRSLFFCDFGPPELGDVLQLYRVDLASDLLTPLSDGSAVDEWPVCSPDGKQLAFISGLAKPAKGEGRNYRIYISDVSGKDRRPADPESDTPQLFPSWSPDGKKIAYTLAKFLGSHIMIRDLEKQTTTRLTPFYIFARQSFWSPRGDRIAYVDMVPFSQKETIWVIKPDGSGRRRITEGPNDETPCWSPDGRKIIFSRKEGVREEGKPRRALYSVDVETREVKKMVSIDNGSLDCPSIVTVPAAAAPQQVSQTPAPADKKKE